MAMADNVHAVGEACRVSFQQALPHLLHCFTGRTPCPAHKGRVWSSVANGALGELALLFEGSGLIRVSLLVFAALQF